MELFSRRRRRHDLPNCQTNLVIALHAPSLLLCHFINTTAYHLGRYEPSSPVSCRAPRIMENGPIPPKAKMGSNFVMQALNVEVIYHYTNLANI